MRGSGYEKQANGKPRVSTMPYTYDIGEGNVEDHWPWTKIGFTPSCTTSMSDVWSAGGLYAFCATAGKW
jgi:hypothetical protein